MVKKLFTLFLGLTLAFCASAQSLVIDPNDVQFWTGTGSNSTVVAIAWDDNTASYTPTVVIWGVRWDGSIYLINALDTIAAYDGRFSYTMNYSYLQTLTFNDSANGLVLTPSMEWNCNSYNGLYGSTLLTSTPLLITEASCDDYTFTGITNIVYATDPNAVSPTTEDETIDPSDIVYWVGTGNTEVIFVGNWCSPDVALAWGVRFDESTTTVEAVMDTIAAYDSRFGYSGSYSIINDVTYNDDNYNLTMLQPTTGYIMYNVNGVLADYGYSDMYVQQGDLIKVGNTDCAISTGDPADWTTWGYAWQTPIVPVSAPVTPIDTTEIPEEATIDFNDILFWVGAGSNEAVLAVNWADTALAWGYRWNGTATVADMMADIAAADPRFSYVGEGFISDINYIDTAAGMTTLLGITPGYYWGSTNNGVMDMGMSQPLNHGDFEKWADSSTGILVDSVWVDDWGGYWNYIYVYPMAITPVTVPDTSHVGIDNHEISRVNAYPNPCTNTLYIINENADRIELYNMNGKLLEAIENRDTQVILNMQQYPAGVYLLKVGNGVQKILKK